MALYQGPTRVPPILVAFITASKRSLQRLCYHRLSVYPQGGVSAPLHAGIHTPLQTSPWADTPPPAQCMLGYGQPAYGTHPTVMYSCSIKQGVKFLFFPIFLSILLFFLFFSNFLLFFLFFSHFTYSKQIFVRYLKNLSLFKYVVYRVHYFFFIKLYLSCLRCLYLL